MLDIISEKADIVMYLQRLTPESCGWVNLMQIHSFYDIISRLKDIPAYRSFFWVMNHEDEANYRPDLGSLEGAFQANVDAIIRNIDAQDLSVRGRAMPAGILNADCRDKSDVDENIVRPLLYHLASNLSAMDDDRIESINQQITKLEELLEALKP